jgi:orotate phosphoribosyltransferase
MISSDATIPQLRERLAQIIKEHALAFGDFKLASGKKSNYFIDGKQATLDAEGAYCLARLILAEIADDKIDAVGGMTLGADPIVGATIGVAAAMGLPLRGFIVRKERKERGMEDQVAGPLRDGDRVVMLEDVVTTGGMTLKAIEAVERERNVDIVKVIAMVDRLQGAQAAVESEGFALKSIFTIEELGIKPAIQ